MRKLTTTKSLMAKITAILLFTQPLIGAVYAVERPTAPAIPLADLIPWEAAKEGQNLEMRATLLSGERDYFMQLQGDNLTYLDLLDPTDGATLPFASFAQQATVRVLSDDGNGSTLASLEIPGPLGAKIKYLVSMVSSKDHSQAIATVTLPDHSRTLKFAVDAGNLDNFPSQKLGWVCGTIIVVAGAAAACSAGGASIAASCVDGCGTGNVSSISTGVCGIGGSCECGDG